MNDGFLNILDKAEAKELGINALGFGLTSKSGKRVGQVWQMGVRGGLLPTDADFHKMITKAKSKLAEPVVSVDIYTRVREPRKFECEGLIKDGLTSLESVILDNWRAQIQSMIDLVEGRKTLVFSFVLFSDSANTVERTWDVHERGTMPRGIAYVNIVKSALAELEGDLAGFHFCIKSPGKPDITGEDLYAISGGLAKRIFSRWMAYGRYWQYEGSASGLQ